MKLLTLSVAFWLLFTHSHSYADKPQSEPPTLLGCYDQIPEGMNLEFSVTSQIDTRNDGSSTLKVMLIDPAVGETEHPPAGSEAFLRCVQLVVGVGQNENWPG